MSQKHEQVYQFARFTADMLGEKDTNAKIQIHQIVKKVGSAKVVELLKETLAIEESGGMKTSDGTHRRSAGGVFFYLAKEHGYHAHSPEQLRMQRAKQRARRRAKKKQDRSQIDDGAKKKVVQDRTAVATQEKKTA